MSKNVVSTKKSYCKVCHDAGKTESEYTSHWVKDLSGKTTCPTLLKTECQYCYKLGHTVKFCSALAKSNKKNSRVVSTSYKKPVPIVNKKPKSGFSALYEDSESEEEEVSNIIEYPSLCSQEKKVINLPKTQPEVKTGWAAIVKTDSNKPLASESKSSELLRQRGFVVLNDYIKSAATNKNVESIPAPVKQQVVITKSWADYSDSEDEEEDLPELDYGQDFEDDTW
jgi:hypothetical protein